MKALVGVRVLDLSQVLAGPLCAQTLGDLGAEVIKIEAPTSGDESRSWPPFHEGTATAFITANRHKKSVTVNLKEPAGREIVYRLVKTVDVVIESNATGVSERLGVDYETLRQHNPRLIYCSISGYGRSGPMKNARGYDMILQAYSGMMSVTGDENSSIIRIPFSPIDQTTGYHAVIGVLSALIQRSISGTGSYIEVSLLETAVSFLGYMIQAYIENGKLPSRIGSRHGGIAPYQAFACVDRPVLIGIANDKLWRAFCKEFADPAIAQDTRFLTNKDRVEHRDECVAVVQSIVKDMLAADLLARLEAIGVPCAPINNFEDVLNDRQILARGLVKALSSEDEKMKAIMLPILFNNEEREPGTAPPRLGQHTDEILALLGYTSAEAESLRLKGVI